MHIYKIAATLFILSGACTSSVAQHGTLTGTLITIQGAPARNIEIYTSKNPRIAVSDSLGQYVLEADTGLQSVYFKYAGFAPPITKEVYIAAGKITELNDTVPASYLQEADESRVVEIKGEKSRTEAGTMTLDVSKANMFPTAGSGIESMLKILTGSNNEMTSQYTVRGGNFDENLVYVNDFEIYRPFLVRSGQQEGLSFVNPDMVGGVNFSVGGFQSRYGDKMSSVLDVTYKKPDTFAATVMGSLLGFQGSIEGASKNRKFTYLASVRQKSNQYLLQSQPTKGQYNPTFTDAQVLLNYRFSNKFEIEAIGNYARNRFTFEPTQSQQAFGYLMEAYTLNTYFQGSEKDQFDTRFGGISATWKPSQKVNLKLLASGFQTNESETYDISGEYGLYAVETDLGQNTGKELWALGTGIIHDYARNFLTANVINLNHKGTANLGRHAIQWGVGFTHVQISDLLNEWERRDSAGYSQPYDPYAIKMAYTHNAEHDLNYSRTTAYLQDNILLGRHVTLNLGVRANYSFLNKEMIISPRGQFSYRPDWKQNIIFRLSAGLYAQPPFYREMRDWNGALNTAQKAQKSAHFAGGFDYNFEGLGGHPFKLVVEAYYKHLWDLVPYQYDNVRIRYYPNETARGYAYGGEVRLFGDIVKDAESWISMAYLKTMQQILDPSTGTYGDYTPRPTDQRFSFGMYFSDYLPMNHNFKIYLNLLYTTGLPYAPMENYTNSTIFRIPDYKRVDVGFAALLLDGSKHQQHAYSFFRGVKSIWASFEVLNLLGIMNTISYTWIQDQTSGGYFAVPNRLTARLPNLKIIAKF